MNTFKVLEEKAGIHFPPGIKPELIKEEAFLYRDRNNNWACDAQPSLVTVSNAGVPALFTTAIDPKVIDAVLAPTPTAEIFGEIKKGDWVSSNVLFTVAEMAGTTNAYNDFATGGTSTVNTIFPQRDTFLYSTNTKYGEREAEVAGMSNIDWVSYLHKSSVNTLNNYQNKTYLFGVAGLNLRGALNDADLPAAIAPTTKAAGGTTLAAGTPKEQLADFTKAITALTNQSKGLVNRSSKLKVIISPLVDMALTTASDNNGNVSGWQLIKIAFPNLTIETCPQYSTAGGELMQVLLEEYGGQKTAVCAFTEKLRMHSVVNGGSFFMQKKTQGTVGFILYRPMFIVQMLGL